MWKQKENAAPGQYLMVETDGGWNIDVFSSLSESDVRQRVAEYARGWTVGQIQLERGVAGVGAVLRVYGRAVDEVSTVAAADEVAQALNSYWTVGGATARAALVSDSLIVKETPADIWGQRIDTALIVIGVLAVAWIVTQIRKGMD